MSFTEVQSYGTSLKRLRASIMLGLPVGDTLPDLMLPEYVDLSPGCVFYKTDTDLFYVLKNDLTWSAAGGGGTIWGALTGNILLQTDLIDYIADQLGDYLPLGGGTMTGYINLHADPTNAMHPVTKSYLENLLTGLNWKEAVRGATTANITLSGLQTIDTVASLADGRYLVKNQTDQTENGIYLMKSGAWVRTDDTNTGAEIMPATVLVKMGGQANTQWTCLNTTAPAIGTDNITFGQISGGGGTYTNGTYLSLAGTVFDIDFGTFSTTQISEGAKLFFTNARAIAATLTGYTAGAGTVTSADTILQALQKLDGNIAALAAAPVKATAAELNTGTNDTKFATALGLEDSKYLNQNNTKISGTATGTDTYVLALTPALTAYAPYQRFDVLFTNANTGASTININGLGAKSILKDASTALASGDISAGRVVTIVYDGTNFQTIGAAAAGGGGAAFGAITGNPPDQTNLQDATLQTAYTPGAGTVALGDTIKQAIQKVDGNQQAGQISINQTIMSIAGNYSQSIM